MSLKTNISVIGSGIQSTVIKGDGTNPAIQGPTDSGTGLSYVNNLTVDGNGRSGFAYAATTASQNNYIFDVYLFTSIGSSLAGISIGDQQSLTVFNLHFINQSIKFTEGVQLTGLSHLELYNSQIAYQLSYAIDDQSSGFVEVWNSFLGGGACVYISNGFMNLYVCQTFGRIEAHNAAQIRHVDSYHANSMYVYDSATIWVSGMSWAEETGNDIQFFLEGASSKIILVNSRAKVVRSGLDVVTIGSSTALFKAMNSVIANTGGGNTISGVSSSTPTVFLYYCSMNKDVVTVNRSADSSYIVSTNVE